MDQEKLATIWNIICFIAGVVLSWCMITGSTPKPLLKQDELFDAVDRITMLCMGDYDHTRALLNELYGWLDGDNEMATVSKELHEIIEAVKNKRDDIWK